VGEYDRRDEAPFGAKECVGEYGTCRESLGGKITKTSAPSAGFAALRRLPAVSRHEKCASGCIWM
jgi:hypothetical protein